MRILKHIYITTREAKESRLILFSLVKTLMVFATMNNYSVITKLSKESKELLLITFSYSFLCTFYNFPNNLCFYESQLPVL